MDGRSKFLLGKDFFIKFIDVKDEDSKRLQASFRSSKHSPTEGTIPFSCVEFLANHYISKTDGKKELLSPDTLVLVSQKRANWSSVTPDLNYKQVLELLIKKQGFKELKGDTFPIKSVAILSKKLTGNFDLFLKSHRNQKKLEDAMIHISYLLAVLGDRYGAIHGDPKTANFTWQELDKSVDMTYRFPSGQTIVRKGVRHLFYLTDLEFFHSYKNLELDGITYNFTKIYDYIDDTRKEIMFVPDLSRNFALNYSRLYGGYNSTNGSLSSRMFCKDPLTLVRFLIVYAGAYKKYPDGFLRKLNIYFTRFCSVSFSEEDSYTRGTLSYSSVSLEALASLMDSGF